MDAHSLAVLELDAIRERLVAETSFEAGAALASELAPSADPAVVHDRQAETAEAVEALALGAPSLAGAHDVRGAAAAAERSAVLRPDALAAIAETSRTALDARRLLDGRPAAPILSGRAAAVAPSLADLAGRIERAVEADGSGLRDDASPALRRLRRELATGRARTAERLRALAVELRAHLQDDFVTERGGRPVLAVRASARSRVPGIVHDTSGSGQTLFVEPFAIVELGNELRELVAAERDEVERILTALSKLAGIAAAEVIAAVDALAAIDLALARGALSRRWGGCPVEPSGEVELLGARHPLLDPATAVPVDLPLGGIRAVVVSGPNTGGKTVGLKTLGVAAILNQCGLRPPARRARLPVFDDVLADIGDEQSIERSLSTFSGHVANLVRILAAAGPRSLVLLDELAAGTDPVEGSALATALLAQLVAQGALVLATTHYPELKEWASATPEAVNAAVGFDPETLAPTYAVTLGRPGASHALAIAGRLGLPDPVIAAARAGIAPERLAVADLLAEAAGAERAAAGTYERAVETETRASERLADAERREQELTAALAAVRAGAEAERARARAEAEAALTAYRRELDELRAEIRAARRAERERATRPASAAADATARERDRRLDAASKRTLRAEQALRESAADPAVPMIGPLGVGDPVMAAALGLRGHITEVGAGQAEVQAGSLRVRVPIAELQPDPRGGRTDRPPERPVRVNVSTPTNLDVELDVRGRRADEAREAVRAHVDAGHLAGMREVRVIHGRGTGAVRAAVRDELDRHPLVERTVPGSADGATTAVIATREAG